MQYFQLKSDAAAILLRDGIRAKAVVIPAGSVVAAAASAEIPRGADRNKMVAVEWAGKSLSMFRVDLLERGERAKGSS
jgi:hypothetical protein